MDLVTVTCNRDFKQMLLQAKSVQKFLKPGTKHWVFINEEESSMYDIDWNFHLSPYYENHTLNVIYCDPSYWQLKYNGWVIQQVHKLQAVNFVDNDYLLLDSKNFFTVPTDLDTWTHEGCGILISEKINFEVWNLWNSTSTSYSKELNVPLINIYYAAETPFLIRKNVAKAAVARDNFAEWFIRCSDHTDASEFIYYSYFLHQAGGKFDYVRRHHSIWPEHAKQSITAWFKEEDHKLMEISGIHRTWLTRATQKDKQRVVKWLTKLGLVDNSTISLFD